MTEKEILTCLESEYREVFVKTDSLPNPYIGEQEIKAILLGTEPGNGYNTRFEYAFGLENPKSKYIQTVQANLYNLNNLNLGNLYIQNICKNYFDCDSFKNKFWKEIAKLWVPLIKGELDARFERNIPILLSADKILEVVLTETEKKRSAKFYYENLSFIDEDKNVFERVLIPFYRHFRYKLSKWDDYRAKVDRYFE